MSESLKALKTNPVFYNPLTRILYRSYRRVLSKAIDGNTTPYIDLYNETPFQKFLKTSRYKLAQRGFPVTRNEKNILKYRNAHAGKRAFLIGNGPSLNQLDLSLMKDEITIGVNSIYLAKERMGFFPTHYVVEDRFVAEDRAKEINALRGPQKWFGNYLRYCLADNEDVNWLNVRMRYDLYENFPYFSKDAARQVWTGGSVTYICMQLAYFLGVKELYLIGFDHHYVIPDDATKEGFDITSNSDDPNHFDPGYFGKGYRWHDPMVDRMEMGYRKAGEFFKRDGRKIINATAGGKLEAFDRVEYHSLFSRR